MSVRHLTARLSAMQFWAKRKFTTAIQTVCRMVMRYGLAFVSVGASLLLNLGLSWWVGPGLSAYLTFLPAIMLTALVAGFWPGIVATALSDLAVANWIIPPIGQMYIEPHDRLEMLIFTCLGILISIAAHLYRGNRAKVARYEYENVVLESQARMAVFAAASFEGIVESEAGRILDCNEQFCKLSGYSVSDLRGMEISSLIREEDRDRVLENILTNRDSVDEHIMHRKDGTQIIVEAHGHCLSPGSAKRHTAIRDITERKRVEEALRSDEARLASELEEITLLQNMSMELLQKQNSYALYGKILSVAARITHSCHASIHMYYSDNWGELRLVAFYGMDEKAAKHWERIDPRSAHTSFSEALRTGRRVVIPDLDKYDFMELEDREWYQRLGIYACQTTPLFSRNGSLVGVISTHWNEPHEPSNRELSLFDVLARQVADLIENERAEEALRNTNASLEQTVQKRTAQLTERAAQLRKMAGELTISEQRERQRLAQILHDGLQQVLVGAKYKIGSAQKSEELRPVLHGISELIDEAIKISRSLMAELSPPVLLQGDLAKAMEWLAGWMHEKHGLNVVVTVRRQIDMLSQDVMLLLFQAIRELLFNVVKHAGVNTARVRLNQINGKILIAVEDEGAGFDPKQLHAGDSHGMGLFAIIERLSHMGGRLRITSAPGQGSRFKLSILCAPAHSRTGKQTTEPVPEKLNQTRILLVDDHQIMRQGLAELLRLEPQFAVVAEASNGQTAVELVREIRPDVVLMDVIMPGMDGIAATHIIHHEHPEIRVIGLSMFNDKEQVTSMHEAGAAAYIAKDSSPETLIEAIRSCVQ